MKRLYTLLYTRTAKFVLGNKLSLFSDIVILAASGYLLVKKAFDFSISGWLLNNALQQSAVNGYVYVSAITLIAAITIKGISLIFEKFPAVKHSTVEPEQIAECLQVINNEIMSHIRKCDSGDPPKIRRLREQHAFDVNIRLITESLAEHIRRSITSIKIKRKDIFISLYTYNSTENILKYELHYDPRRDLVKSREIDLSDQKFDSYECAKCMKSTDSTAYVTGKDKYTKGNSKRHKSLHQYMGCKLENNGQIFGFLNIEFHNNSIFIDESEMQDFMEENIFPFKLLLEYQYLKSEFFRRFEQLDKHWEVA